MTFRRLFLTVLPLIAACAHADKSVAARAPAPVAPSAAAAAPPLVAAAPVNRSCTADAECTADELCVSARCVVITAEMPECHGSAHFDFDRADIHSLDLPKLQRVARCLNALPSEQALVEGNCDERGTVQYNIALGFRRAHAVAKYLEALGIAPASLSEVSYGKEEPLCTSATESCWAMNRRADVTRGAEAKNVAARIRADERRERVARAKSAGTEKAVASAAHGAVQARRPAREHPAAAESTSPPSK